MPRLDPFHKKGKGKSDGWDKPQQRSLSSSNLAAYSSYGSPPPLLSQSLSGTRQVQRSLSSGTANASSILSRLHLLDYPHRSKDYELQSLCGTGATAKVYKAFCKPLKETVAVKIVDLELTSRQNLDTIIKEAQLLSQMRHPNILAMLACFVEETTLYMVTPYVIGGSVESAMNYGFSKGLEERVVAPIMLSVLHALVYLHKQSIVHRDIKASNVLLNHDVVVLGDFGIATRVERSLEESKKSCEPSFGEYLMRKSYNGTPVWMAPEVIAPEVIAHEAKEQCQGHGLKADIYAFGITLCELALGKPPFAGMPLQAMTNSKVHDDPPALPPHHEGRSFSHDMRDVVAMCLQKDPDDRPTAATLLKHRFFKWIKHPRDATNELLSGVPGPIKRLDSLDRRKKELMQLGLENPDFGYAVDERIPLGNVRSKDAAQATQQWDAKSGLAVLHKMLRSKGVSSVLDKSHSNLAALTEGISPKSSSSAMSTTPNRRLSFTRTKSFAKGEHWPHLPPLAFNHCKGILFASGGRKGFGVSSSWGHGFVITNLGSADSPCWTGPVFVNLSVTKFVSFSQGENSRESIILFRDMEYHNKLLGVEAFRLGDFKLIDVVAENLPEDEIFSILKEGRRDCHGVAFRHYHNSKIWDPSNSIVRVDSIANDKLYKKCVCVERIMKGKEAPPVQFRGLIDVLISAQQGRYESSLLSRNSDNDSDHSHHREDSSTNPGQSSKKLHSGSFDVIQDTAYTAEASQFSCCGSDNFPMRPVSSFSIDGDSTTADGGQEVEYESQPSQDLSQNLCSLRLAPATTGIGRSNSEPAMVSLIEGQDSLTLSADAGTPPPPGLLSEEYYGSVVEPFGSPPKPSNSEPTLHTEQIPERQESEPRAIKSSAQKQGINSGISPPSGGSSDDILNPFSPAAKFLPESASLHLKELWAPAPEGSLREIQSEKMPSCDPPSTPNRSVSWRPPKPSKTLRASTKSVELSRPGTPLGIPISGPQKNS